MKITKNQWNECWFSKMMFLTKITKVRKENNQLNKISDKKGNIETNANEFSKS